MMPNTLYALARYLMHVYQDGDYLNDWLTHLTAQLAGALVELGVTIARMIGA